MSRSCPRIPRSRNARRRIIAVTLTFFLAQQWVGTAVAVASVVAGIVPAAQAPTNQHPLMDTARNGVPIVDIAPPSVAGVSSNLYTQFNTASNGAILNNSAGNVPTQLGGWIGGNPLLGPTPAKIILNQVISGNPSQLLGALEVAGPTAGVVVANPSGITCNGCSFINTNHATLTTGLPQFDATGHLQGFDVTQGTIAVGANGLDAQQVERLDLDARDLTVGGGIWAQHLGVVAGAATVPYGSTAATAQTGTGTAPLFAVDVSALGGMYAHTIDLVATEAGLGVNSQGQLAALQGNLRLSANGNLTLADTAAQGSLALSGTQMALSGVTESASGSTMITTPGTFTNTGEIEAASGLTIQATGITNTGHLLQYDPTQGLAVTTSGTLNNTGGIIASHGAAILTASDLNNAGGTIATEGGLAVTAPTLVNTGGTLVGGTSADVTTASASLGGTIDSEGALDLTVHGAYANTGTLATPGDLNVAAASLTNAAGATLSSGGNLTATTTGDLTNAGTLDASGSTTLAAGGTLTNAGLINSGASTNLTATTLANTGRIYGNALGITAGRVTNTGGAVIASRGDLSLAAATLSNTGGSTILALGTMGLAGGFDPATGAPTTFMSSLLNASATIQSGGNMDIQATDITNRNDHLVLGTQTVAQGINTVLVQQYTDDQGTKSPDGSPIGPLYNASQLTRAPNANSSTWVGPNGPMGAYIQYNLTNQTTTTTVVQSTAPGQILAGGALTVTGGTHGSLVNANSLIVAGGALAIANGLLTNQSAQGSQTVTQSGNYSFDKYVNCCSDWLGLGGYNGWYGVAGGAYNPPSTTTAFALATTTVTAHAALAPLSPLIPTDNGLGLSSPAASTQPPVLSLPASPLFAVQSAPTAPYLVETDPAFTNQQNFLSSNYYLQQLSINPAQWQRRYGDGFVEQQLVRHQILALTGQLRLTGYANTQAEYAGLMQAGVAFAKAYGIAPGVSLSAQQMALVTTDMVLLTTDTVRLPDGRTEKVLVPQVYLAHPQGQDLTAGGALIAGGTVQITTAQDLVNGGTITGTSVQASIGADLTNTGTITGYQVGLSAGQDLQDLSGLIAGSTRTSLSAGRDLLLATQTTTATGATGSTTSLDHVATVQGGTITLQAARDLIAQGATIAASGGLTAVAGRNLSLGAATTTYQFASGGPLIPGRNNVLQTTTTTQHGTTVSAGGNVTLLAQAGDLNINASTVGAGGNATLIGQNVTIASGVNSRTATSQLVGNGGYGDNTSSTQSAAGASVRAGQALSLQAVGNGQTGTGDITLTGADLSAQSGAVTVQAAHDLNVNTLALNDSTTYQSHRESSGFFGGSTNSAQASSTRTAQWASLVTGPSVALTAGHDLTVTGSQVTGTGTTSGTGQVDLTAGGAMTIQAAALSTTANSSTRHNGGVFGRKSHDTSQFAQTTAQAAQISGRALTLQSGGDMTFQAAQFTGTRLVAQAGTVNGQTVDPTAQLHVNAAINDRSQTSSHSGNTLFTQSKAGQGTIQQTLQYTTIAVPGASKAQGPVQLHATGGITVGATNLPTAATGNAQGGGTTPTVTLNLKQQAQQLASEPGLGYLAPLTERSDVSWQQVQLASQHWNYHEAGLSGAGAAIIAIAVAVCTAGAGAALVGLAATSAGGAMASAAFTSLVTQASISLADNGGNIGETLKDLGSRSSVRALATSVATAGLTTVSLDGGQSLNQMAGLSNLGDTGRSLATGSVSSTTLEGIAGRAVVNAGVSTALDGTSFRQGLINGAVADVSAIGANAIGSTWGGTGTDPNAVLQTLAHGALGCAEAGLTGGNCGAGAAGAATESILGNLVTLPSTAQGTVSRTDATVYATSAAILGAVAGQAAGGDALSGANTAINSAVNNRLLHPDEQKTLAQMKKGQSSAEQYRLSAAACADTHCAAGIPANSPYKAPLEALQATGQNYPLERAQLRETHLFGYSSWNAITDAASRYEALTRVTGAIQAAGGLVGYTAGGGMMAAGCETGLACVAGFALATTSADYAQAGYRQMLTGTYTPTLGQQALTDLGLSPTTAALTYGGFGLVAGVGAGAASAFTAADGVGAAETGVGGIGAGVNSAVAVDAASSTQAARLNMQLSAEQAAGVRAPTSIAGYSDHALTQIASRDGGIGVNQAAVNDAFDDPVAIQYVPSKYGPTFKYIGKDAIVVVNPQGNVVTAWGTSAAGVAK